MGPVWPRKAKRMRRDLVTGPVHRPTVETSMAETDWAVVRVRHPIGTNISMIAVQDS